MALTKNDLAKVNEIVETRTNPLVDRIESLENRIDLLPTKKEFLHWMDKLYSKMTRMENEMITANNRIGKNEYNIDINSQRLNAIENRFKSHQTPVVS